MSDRDTITLPREVVEKAVKAFENGCPPTCEKGMIDSGGFHPWGEPALVPCPACLAFEHLRTALAAEQPKQEPVAYFDLQKQVFYWARPTMIDVPKTIALEPLPLYAAPPDIEALRQDAERYRWGVENARWVRHEHEAYVAIPVAVDADLSCTPMMTAAIDAAMKEDKR